MTRPRSILVIGLAVAALVSVGCKRTGISEPSPFGPVSFGLSFELEARPNVLIATDAAPMAEIRATVKRNSQPLKDQVVVFSITIGPGQFDNYSGRIVAVTDANGVAAVTYIGPTKYQITGDDWTMIQSNLQTSSPEYIHKDVEVKILWIPQ